MNKRTRDKHVENMTFDINTGNPARDATQMIRMSAASANLMVTCSEILPYHPFYPVWVHVLIQMIMNDYKSVHYFGYLHAGHNLSSLTDKYG